MLLFVSSVGGQTPATSKGAAAAAQQKSEAGKGVHQMFLEDQADMPTHGPNGVSPITGKEYEERGAGRRARVREMLAKSELKTGEDFYDASFIFQHGESGDDYLMAHVLAMAAVVKGYDTAKWIAAATLDRYLQFVKQPQVFGTQYPLDPKVAHPEGDPHAGRFAGRTQQPYNEELVPDSLRTAFCVADREQQRQNVATLNSGKYPGGKAMVAAGCSR